MVNIVIELFRQGLDGNFKPQLGVAGRPYITHSTHTEDRRNGSMAVYGAQFYLTYRVTN